MRNIFLVFAYVIVVYSVNCGVPKGRAIPSELVGEWAGPYVEFQNGRAVTGEVFFIREDGVVVVEVRRQTKIDMRLSGKATAAYDHAAQRLTVTFVHPSGHRPPWRERVFLYDEKTKRLTPSGFGSWLRRRKGKVPDEVFLAY